MDPSTGFGRCLLKKVAVSGALALALLVAPAAAQATLGVKADAGGLLVQDQTNLGDFMDIFGSSNGYRIKNDTPGDVIPFFRGIGCSGVQGDARSSFCLRVNSRLTVEGEGGNDSIDLTGIAVISSAFVIGGPGNDSVAGHPGQDDIQGGSGRDGLSGGADRDTIVGGSETDFLLGGTNVDRLTGGSGDDDIEGQEGNDIIDGGSGRDDLGNGPITKTNEAGDDTIEGGSGGDRIEGGSGIDSLLGESGEDVITSKEPDGAAPKADQVNCGDDFDSVIADLLDTVSSSCEDLERSPVGETPHVRLPAVLNVSGAGVARVRLRCPRRTTIGCRGTLSLRLAKRGARRPARTSYRIRAGRSRTVTVTLTAREAGRVRGRVRGILTSLEEGRLGLKTTIRRSRLR